MPSRSVSLPHFKNPMLVLSLSFRALGLQSLASHDPSPPTIPIYPRLSKSAHALEDSSGKYPYNISGSHLSHNLPLLPSRISPLPHRAGLPRLEPASFSWHEYTDQEPLPHTESLQDPIQPAVTSTRYQLDCTKITNCLLPKQLPQTVQFATPWGAASQHM